MYKGHSINKLQNSIILLVFTHDSRTLRAFDRRMLSHGLGVRLSVRLSVTLCSPLKTVQKDHEIFTVSCLKDS